MKVLLQRNDTTILGFDPALFPRFLDLSDAAEGSWRNFKGQLRFIVNDSFDFELQPGLILQVRRGDEFVSYLE